MPPRTESVVSRYFFLVSGAGMGLAAMALRNAYTRRPVFSGIQKHVLAVVTGGFLGEQFHRYTSRFFAERDAVIRHYVELHPEDFPPKEKKKYKDVFEPWLPIR